MADEKKPEVAKMLAPKDASGITIEGVEYLVEKGVVKIDPAHVAQAREHGYTDVGGDK